MTRRLWQMLGTAALLAACQWLVPARLAPIRSAWAATPDVTCRAVITSLNFGNVQLDEDHPSRNLNLSTTGYLTYYCTNHTAASQTFTACFSIGNPDGAISQRTLNNGNDRLEYGLYQDAAHSIPWGSAYRTNWGSPVQRSVTVPAGEGSTSPPVTLPIYAAIASGQDIDSGTYTDTYGQGDVAVDAVSGTACMASPGSGEWTGFQVVASVSKTCQVTTNPLSFPAPSDGDPSGETSSATLTVTCTSKHRGYEIGLDNGQNYGNGQAHCTGARCMRGGPTLNDYIGYGLFQDSGYTQPWGNTQNSNTVTTAEKDKSQTFTVYGRVNAAQGMMPPGNYFDVVTVFVYY